MAYKGETKKKKEASRDKEQAGTGTGTERHETRALKGAQRAESVGSQSRDPSKKHTPALTQGHLVYCYQFSTLKKIEYPRHGVWFPARD